MRKASTFGQARFTNPVTSWMPAAKSTIHFKFLPQHYHMDKEIKYPVAEQQALKDSGTVYINTTQTYCLMWTNPQEHTVTLRYNIDTAKR
jgi:hypothetical protein